MKSGVLAPIELTSTKPRGQDIQDMEDRGFAVEAHIHGISLSHTRVRRSSLFVPQGTTQDG
jgi:hypothetical protein